MTITLKNALKSLLVIPNQVEQQFGQNEQYCPIVKFIKNHSNDEDSYFIPTIKELERITGLKHYQLNKYLITMYKELVGDALGFNYVINKTEIYFLISHKDNYSSFECSSLPYLPKIGDNFSLPFLRRKFGLENFYVHDIHQTLADDILMVDITLKQGFFNAYWNQRRSEAIFKHEISIRDQYNLSETDLKEKLGYGRY